MAFKLSPLLALRAFQEGAGVSKVNTVGLITAKHHAWAFGALKDVIRTYFFVGHWFSSHGRESNCVPGEGLQAF